MMLIQSRLDRTMLLKFLPMLLLLIVVFPAYGQDQSQQIKLTSGGTINVEFSTDPVNPNPGDQTYLKISFINKQTNVIQQHIDYRITVTKGQNQVFGIPITHTAEGTVSIPYQFQEAGNYQISVSVEGILFQPIPPETADFMMNIGGTQTSGNQTSQGMGNQTSPGSQQIQIPGWVKNNAKWWSEGSIDDGTFASGIQYMIKQGIIQIPTTVGGQATTGVSIPQWVKTNAGWWASGQIDDQTFVSGIQFLIKIGIISV